MTHLFQAAHIDVFQEERRALEQEAHFTEGRDGENVSLVLESPTKVVPGFCHVFLGGS